MKLTLSREQLLEPLHQVIGAIERRQTMPSLANVLISIKAGEMALTGTDLEIELVSKAPIDTDVETEISVPGRKLFDICKNLPENSNLKLEVDKGRFILSAARSRFALATLPASEFPQLEDIHFPFEISLSQSKLLYVLEKTSFAMAQQDVRYYLNGLLLDVDASCLRAVATDGHRLSLSEATLDTAPEESKQVIIPRKGVLELQRLLSDSDAALRLSISDNHIRVNIDNLRFTSKLIDGRYPEYQRVMPTDSDKQVLVDKNALRQALARTSILSNEKFRGVRVSVDSGQIRMQTQNPEQEEAEEELSAEYEGPQVEVGFNVTYLLDVLNVLESEKALLMLKDSNSSCLIKEPGNEQNCFVIMPMRL